MTEIFDFNKKYVLEDERVLLRSLQKDDYKYLLPYALHEPDLWKYSLINPAGENGLKHYINIAVDAREANKEYAFIVYDKRTNEYAGSTRFYDIQLAMQTLQLGYTWYGKKFQGTGLNNHCKYLLLRFAFDEIGMERVEFRADANNERSIAAMKSVGCKAEGILRSNMLKHDGERRDSIVLSILKNEWLNGVRQRQEERL